MADHFEKAYVVNAPLELLAQTLRDPGFARQLNITLQSENPYPPGVWYHFQHGASLTSWGEKIYVALDPKWPAATMVVIRSECTEPEQRIDWGKNKKVVENVYDKLMRAIGMQNKPQPVQQPVQPQFVQQPVVLPPVQPQFVQQPVQPQYVRPPVQPQYVQQPVQPQFVQQPLCQSCGAPRLEGDVFCGKCGAKF